MVVTHPERHRGCRIVDKDPADVGVSWKEVLGDVARPRIEAKDAIVVLAAGPRLAIAVCGHIVGPGARCRRGPFLEAFGPRIEHADAIGAVLAKPQAALRVHHAAARP